MAAKLRECLAENGQDKAAQDLADEFGLDEGQM
jgi:hypothetical protein